MKRKEIEFNAEELVGSVESFAAHMLAKKKLTLRTRKLNLPPPIKPLRPKDIVALRLQLRIEGRVVYDHEIRVIDRLSRVLDVLLGSARTRQERCAENDTVTTRHGRSPSE